MRQQDLSNTARKRSRLKTPIDFADATDCPNDFDPNRFRISGSSSLKRGSKCEKGPPTYLAGDPFLFPHHRSIGAAIRRSAHADFFGWLPSPKTTLRQFWIEFKHSHEAYLLIRYVWPSRITFFAGNATMIFVYKFIKTASRGFVTMQCGDSDLDLRHLPPILDDPLHPEPVQNPRPRSPRTREHFRHVRP